MKLKKKKDNEAKYHIGLEEEGLMHLRGNDISIKKLRKQLNEGKNE